MTFHSQYINYGKNLPKFQTTSQVQQFYILVFVYHNNIELSNSYIESLSNQLIISNSYPTIDYYVTKFLQLLAARLSCSHGTRRSSGSSGAWRAPQRTAPGCVMGHPQRETLELAVRLGSFTLLGLEKWLNPREYDGNMTSKH